MFSRFMNEPSPDRVNFLVVGCQRCGTTWLDAALREHPQVFLPATKQSYYFDRHLDKGDAWWLERFADSGPDHIAVGEVATGYTLPHAIPPMATLVPHAKLVMTMRHPVERAFSFFQSRRAEQGWSSFEQAMEADPEIIARGKYIDQIEQLLTHYPREQVLLLLYDDFAGDNAAFLRSVLTFIGVDPTFESSQAGRRRNAAMFPRLRRALHTVGLKPVLAALSRSQVGDAVRRANNRRRTDPSTSIAPETRRRLVDEYRPFNDRLGAFLGRDLSHWNQ
jgi:hypothetical protein